MYIGLRRPELCPQCGETRILRLYSYKPDEVGWLEIRRGQARLFKTQPAPDLPNWECSRCLLQWSDHTDPAQQELDRILARVWEKKGG